VVGVVRCVVWCVVGVVVVVVCGVCGAVWLSVVFLLPLLVSPRNLASSLS